MSQNFQPIPTGSLNITATTTTSALTIPARPTVVRLHNASAQIIFVEFGTAGNTTAATLTTSMPIPAGGVELFEKGLSDRISVIVAATTGLLYVTPGEGQ